MKNTKHPVLNKLIALFILFSTLGLYAQTTKADVILNDFYGNKDILVASHRAAHQKYPENSIKAIKECIRLGVDIVELDVRQTKDGELVIMHDKTVDRTTNGTGEVNSLTFNELNKLYLLFNNEESGEKIPRFEDVLKETKNRILIDIDFKEDSIDAVNKTYALIKKYDMEDQILFFIHDYKHITLLQNLNPKVKIMPRAYSKQDVKDILKHNNIYITHIDESFYKPRLMKKMIKKGSRVWINALGKYDKMEFELKNSGFDELLKKKYINVIQTDLPEELLKYLKEKKLHK